MVEEFVLAKISTQLQQIVSRSIGSEAPWTLVGVESQPAVAGKAGYLGDHLRVTLNIDVQGHVRILHLFVKCLPLANKPKVEFINDHKIFQREALMFRTFEEMPRGDGSTRPWRVEALLFDDSIIVMPDLSKVGYVTYPQTKCLDLEHALLVVASMAQFHAAFANYETGRKLLDPTFNFLKENGDTITEPIFKDGQWLRTAAKLTTDFIVAFSTKYNNKIAKFESEIYGLFVRACDTLTEYDDTLNVVVHKDLWVNNVLFRYEEGEPKDAVLLDFQCGRYVPPAFDLMQFLYLTTSRRFREVHETTVLKHYFSVFEKCVDDPTSRKLKELNYGWESLAAWCETSRLFGLVEAASVLPFAMLDPRAAERVFDDPDTFEAMMVEDRSQPVLEYARRCPAARDRQLEVAEELVEKYLVNS